MLLTASKFCVQEVHEKNVQESKHFCLEVLMIKTQKLSWFNCSSSTIGGHFFFGLAAFALLLIPRLLFFP